MSPAVIALLLALSAPAPKADKGLPKDLVDLIPEDTAGVLVVDVPKAAKSEIGQAILKIVMAEQKADEPVQVADFVRDAELVMVSQFLIDKGFGDFCFLIRHKEGSPIPKSLIAQAEKAGKDKAPEMIGKRTVYSIKNPDFSFALVDDRTLMVVLALGNEKQVKETRAAAYGDREKPGPSDALRKMLEANDKDARSVRLFGSHPTKLGHSTWLVLAAFGVKDKLVESFTDKVVAYRGGIKEGDVAEIELRITTKNADVARELLKAYESSEEDEPFVKELRATAKAIRDGDDVLITAKLTRAMVERFGKVPNK